MARIGSSRNEWATSGLITSRWCSASSNQRNDPPQPAVDVLQRFLDRPPLGALLRLQRHRSGGAAGRGASACRGMGSWAGTLLRRLRSRRRISEPGTGCGTAKGTPDASRRGRPLLIAIGHPRAAARHRLFGRARQRSARARPARGAQPGRRANLLYNLAASPLPIPPRPRGPADGAPRDQERHPPLRRLHRRRQRQLRRRGRRVLHAARPLRLRQDDAAADDRRLRPARQRARSSSTASTSTDTPAEKRPIHTVFQSYALFPHMTVAQNIAFPLRMAGKGRRRGRARRVREAIAAGQARQAGAALSARAVRRPEAAGGARPRAGQPPAPAAARRAAGRARRQAARADADRADPPAARRRRHLRLRHPLAGRGAGAVAPDRGDEPRRDRADGRAATSSTASRRTASSPTSSATSTCTKPRSRRPATTLTLELGTLGRDRRAARERRQGRDQGRLRHPPRAGVDPRRRRAVARPQPVRGRRQRLPLHRRRHHLHRRPAGRQALRGAAAELGARAAPSSSRSATTCGCRGRPRPAPSSTPEPDRGARHRCTPTPRPGPARDG